MGTSDIVYVADSGSVAKGKFCWASSHNPEKASSDPEKFVEAIVDDLGRGVHVAHGFESPLFVPCEPHPGRLGKARTGECNQETGNRAFTSSTGATVLVTGI